MSTDGVLAKRLMGKLTAVAEEYPNIWSQSDHIQKIRSDRSTPVWPKWCYLPVSGALAIAEKHGDDIRKAAPVASIIAGLAAWRQSKGIYVFDRTVLESVWATPVTGDLPSEILLKLPEWCCYIATPGAYWPIDAMNGTEIQLVAEDEGVVAHHIIYGFFVWLECNLAEDRTELRLIIDSDRGYVPIPIQLGAGGIAAGLESLLDYIHKHSLAPELLKITKDMIPALSVNLAREIAPLVSLVIYLCSTNAEILGADGSRPAPVQPVRTKRGPRVFVPGAPRQWNVAFRLGAAIRRARQSERDEEDRGGTHASPRAHVRRAHWHSFWTGPRTSDARDLITKWLPPIAINVGDIDNLPVVKRPVEIA